MESSLILAILGSGSWKPLINPAEVPAMNIFEGEVSGTESIDGAHKTTAAAEVSGDIRGHSQRSVLLAHTSFTLTFALLWDSHLNVSREPSYNDELKGMGAASWGSGWGEAGCQARAGALQQILNTVLCWAASFTLFKHQISVFCSRRHPEPVTACRRKGNHMKGDALYPGWAGLTCLFVLCVVFF